MFDDITRNGFSSSFGRFRALPGGIERFEGSVLRQMFLPRLSPQGRKTVETYWGFVHSQLRHYGVQFNEEELSGNGIHLMKNALLEGKCDRVPVHILELRDEMHAEWLERCSLETLSVNPQFVLDRFFLCRGLPDHTKTPGVVGIPYPRGVPFRPARMCQAVHMVPSLSCGTGIGPDTHAVFIGWDEAAVRLAARQHCSRETAVVQAKKQHVQEARRLRHMDYLSTLCGRPDNGPMTATAYSPVGSYLVSCKKLDQGHSRRQVDATWMDVRRTTVRGVYEASFNFGSVEGAMIMALDVHQLRFYTSDNYGIDDYHDDNENNDEVYDGDDEESEDYKKEEERDCPCHASCEGGQQEEVDTRRVDLKRKFNGLPDHLEVRPVKKTKLDTPTRQYTVKLKARATSDGTMVCIPRNGTLAFNNYKMARFSGVCSFFCADKKIRFSAMKISDRPLHRRHPWSEYVRQEIEEPWCEGWY